MSNEYFYDENFYTLDLSPADLLSLPNERLADFARRYTPSMNRQDLLFCRDRFRKEHRVPTETELSLLDRMVALRKKAVVGTLLARVGIDDSIIAESYEKQMQHRSMLYGQSHTPLSLDGLARISSEYQERIGKTDRIPPALMETDGTAVLRSHTSANEYHKSPLPAETALILLLPTREAEAEDLKKTEAFLATIRSTIGFRADFTVGTGGLSASLAIRCKGVFIDPSRLPDSDSKTLDNLTDRFRGHNIVGMARESAEQLCQRASEYGLLGIYFAKTTETGRLRTPSDPRYTLDLSMDFLRMLASAKDEGTVSIARESFLTVCAHKPMSVKDASGNETILSDHMPIRKENTIMSPVFSTVRVNGFSAAMNTTLNAVLRLIARGIDRRTMGLAVTYSFPKYAADAEDLGKNAAMILGTCRMAEELEISEQPPKLCYHDQGDRTLTCLAYAPLPSQMIPPFAAGNDSNLCFLAFGRTPDGVPSFEGLRRMCDYFTALCRTGSVLSAQSVNGDLTDAIRSMTKEKQVAFTDLMEDYENRFCQGLLLEISAKNMPEHIPILGKIAEA